MKKVKIVLDADVLIHFSKAGCLSILPTILPEFDHIILSTVYEETKSIKKQIDNQVNLLGTLSIEKFEPKGAMKLEYAKLRKLFGKGESACMAYCKFTNNVIGSSNIKDIKDYCTKQEISYLTTLDFLYYAFIRKIMTKKDCDKFIQDVISHGSKLPVINIMKYTPNISI